MRLQRSSRRLSRSRPVWLLAAAGALLLTLRSLALHRAVGVAPATGALALPSRWPACTPVRSVRHRAEPPARRVPFDGVGSRFAIVSTWQPTRCGLATFSAGLRSGLLASGAAAVDVLAVHLRSDPPHGYGPEVVFTIQQDAVADYELAAAFIKQQHEYGIFGGYRGELVVALVRAAGGAVPFVTTLHTVESVPSPMVQHTLTQLLAHSVAVTALSPSGCRSIDAWNTTVGMATSDGMCRHTPHGVAQLPLCLKPPLKRVLGISNRFVILCGGLLSPPKGLERVLEALPLIAASVPTVLLVVVGQAHPVLGVHYLEKLQDAARALRVDHLVRFHSSYVPEADLLHLYQASDVFICAHTTAEQTSSGTMLLAMTSGAAVIATPFAQAAELIDGANGVLVPFNDSTAIARAAASLARKPRVAAAIRMQAHTVMSLRSWDTVAARYSQLVSASPPTRLLPLRFMAHEGGGSAPLAAFRSAVYAEAFNGKVSVAVARNEAWVDGVGPGWHPTDTFFSRHRPVWGVDSLIMNCFVSYELRAPQLATPEKYMTRSLEEASATLDVRQSDSAASMEERWRGALGTSGVDATVLRRMTVRQNSLTARVDLSVQLRGRVAAGSDSWLTAGFDQLASNSALRWDEVSFSQGNAAVATLVACAWDGATHSVPDATAFALHSTNTVTGHAAHVLLERAPGQARTMHVHFTCNDERRLHSLHFDVVLNDAHDVAKSADIALDMTWT